MNINHLTLPFCNYRSPCLSCNCCGSCHYYCCFCCFFFTILVIVFGVAVVEFSFCVLSVSRVKIYSAISQALHRQIRDFKIGTHLYGHFVFHVVVPFGRLVLYHFVHLFLVSKIRKYCSYGFETSKYLIARKNAEAGRFRICTTF